MLISLLLGGPTALASEVKTQWTYQELWLHVKQVHPLADIAEAELDDFRAKLTHSERWWYPRMSANNILAGLPGEGSVLKMTVPTSTIGALIYEAMHPSRYLSTPSAE